MNGIRVNLRMMFLLIASFIFYYLQGGYIATGFFFSIFSIFILAAIMNGVNYFAIKFTVCIDENIYFSGDEVEITLNIQNRSFFSIPYMIVKRHVIEESGDNYEGEALSLGVNGEGFLRYKIKFYHRGIYDLDDFEIFISDYFNIFTLRKKEKSHGKVIVYPKIYCIVKEDYSGGFNLLDTQNSHDTSIEDMHDVREMRRYVYGDSVKKINWKLSAKTGNLIVKNYNYRSGKECFIFLDMNKENYVLDSKGIMEERLIDFTESIIKEFSINIDVYSVYINNSPPCEIKINSHKDIQRINEYFLESKSCGEISIGKYMINIIDERFLGKQFIIVVGKITQEFIDSLLIIRGISRHICVFYLIAEEKLRDKLKEEHIKAFNMNLMMKKK